MVVEQEQAEINQGPGHRLAAVPQVPFRQVQAPWPHHQHGGFLVQRVFLSFRAGERDLPAHRVPQVDLPVEDIEPGRCGGILEIGHVHPGARVQRVDDHLAAHRAGDLGAAVEHFFRNFRDPPLGFADVGRGRVEIRQPAGIELRLAVPARRQQFPETRREALDQFGQKTHGLRVEDFSGLVRLWPGQFQFRLWRSHGGEAHRSVYLSIFIF